MLDSIQQSVLQLLPARRKTGQNGWLSFNAVCCIHNGETADTRGRGGIKTNAGQISYHCFNCGFTTSFIPGRHLSYKFRKLLSWLGADDLTIRRLVVDAVRIKEVVAPEELVVEPDEEIKYEVRSLPEGATSFNEWRTFLTLQDDNYPISEQLKQVVQYLDSRAINYNTYEFYTTENESYNLHKRVIVPYYYQGQLVGYTARALDNTVKPKYWSSHPADFVFNLDKQKTEGKFVIVTEGPFDAMSVDGVAISGAELSDIQIEVIDRLQREVIVVPDFDIKVDAQTGKRSWTGQKLISRAIEAGWTVSFPIWHETAKDVNDAVVKYGKLFVLKSILEGKESSKLKIELMKKKIYNS